MKKLIVMMAFLSSSFAFADGFVCKTLHNDLIIRVYNNTEPAYGTRNSAVMVLSDPAIDYGRKTIAKFTGVNTTLSNVSTNYAAFVDLRYLDSRRKGELILGTKLGYIKNFYLDVNFSYGHPIAPGEITTGNLEVLKRNGDSFDEPVRCKRYLKG
ncbi:MAG: hypothetical protein HYW49_00160 [Deltaproteobacteria bacterium]|nr:hypothetical protein [Deltaproteobacteria bacterium]